MAKRKASSRRGSYRAKRRGFSRKPTLSLAVVAGLSVPFVQTYHVYETSGVQASLSNLTSLMTGYNPATAKFEPARLKAGLLPVMVGAGIHKLAGYLGLNRAIAGAGIPFIRI